VTGLGWTCGNILKSVSYELLFQNYVTTKKVAVEFDDNIGNLKVVKEVGTR
jgi:hypothetical protein